MVTIRVHLVHQVVPVIQVLLVLQALQVVQEALEVQVDQQVLAVKEVTTLVKQVDKVNTCLLSITKLSHYYIILKAS